MVEGLSSLRPESMAEVRLVQPLRALASSPAVQCKVHSQQMQLAPASDHIQRLLIWQQPILRLQSSDLRKIQKLVRNGYVLVLDWDDDPGRWPELA